jgi:hypothetical protein
MKNSSVAACWLAALLLASFAAPAAARAPTVSAEDGIRATLGRWYEELRKKEEGRHSSLTSPQFIEASPPYRIAESKSRKAAPRIYSSLAADALKFSWEIDSIRRDSAFARVQVWERGYFYASAARQTYERAAATTFVLERSEKDGRWLILAHQSSSQGIPPNKITNPMPDLSGEAGEADPAAAILRPFR